MVNKKCSKCEINYVESMEDDLCELCKKEGNKTTKTRTSNNKDIVVESLLPLLRNLPEYAIIDFLQKETSYQLFRLRLPLLIKCANIGKETCRNEIKDPTGHNRYYAEPVLIHGNYYHICSQWWSADYNHSKDILKKFAKIPIEHKI